MSVPRLQLKNLFRMEVHLLAQLKQTFDNLYIYIDNILYLIKSITQSLRESTILKTFFLSSRPDTGRSLKIPRFDTC